MRGRGNEATDFAGPRDLASVAAAQAGVPVLLRRRVTKEPSGATYP